MPPRTKKYLVKFTKIIALETVIKVPLSEDDVEGYIEEMLNHMSGLEVEVISEETDDLEFEEMFTD